MSGMNLGARPPSAGSIRDELRDIRRQIAFIRSSRALSLRSVLAGVVAGADSIAEAALAAAVLAQGRADAAWGLADSRARLLAGSAAGTTDALGEFTVTHSLGVTPALAAAQPLGQPDLTCGLIATTTSTATFVLVDRTTGAAASAPYDVRWSVIA